MADSFDSRVLDRSSARTNYQFDIVSSSFGQKHGILVAATLENDPIHSRRREIRYQSLSGTPPVRDYSSAGWQFNV
jgi:hypothetical protein